jgi:exodeoxyribonuclease V alpha subunit
VPSADSLFPPPEGNTLSGVVKRLTFVNPENDFAVIRLEVAGPTGTVTAVGPLGGLTAGEEVELTGRWDKHAKYGRQFVADSVRVRPPSTTDGLIRYLGSGLIKGLGPVMAQRLVERFGEDTLRVLDETPRRLLTVPGIGGKRLAQIKQAWREQRQIRRAMVFLQGLGLGPAQALKVCRRLGDATVEAVQADPYVVYREVKGIGFLTADRMAQEMGFALDAPVRLGAGVLYVIETATDEGHVFVRREHLAENAAEVLAVDQGLVQATIDRLSGAGDLEVVTQPEGEVVYPAWLARCERELAWRLAARLSEAGAAPPTPAEWDLAGQALELTLAPDQARAVAAAVSAPVAVITGGPGTGKTTIVRAVIAILHRRRQKFVLAAPTGRAAKRLAELTGAPAQTVHRLLEFDPQAARFGRNEDRPLEADAVIVDEASMLDLWLSHHLLKAVAPGTRLILVGDVDQLPSVGPGAVLREILNSGRVEAVYLTEIHRQAAQGLLIPGAHAVNHGRPPRFHQGTEPGDLYFIERDDPVEAARVIEDLVAERIPRGFGLDPLTDVQVLSPMHKGEVGTESLNLRLQARLNPGRPGLERGRFRYSRGDRVMCVKNDYDRGVFNGELGRVTAVDPDEAMLVVDFDGRRAAYEALDLEALTLAYAVTVHKSQGSEFPAVVVPLLTSHFVMLKRNLLYTALTRAKRLCVLVGSRSALDRAVRTTDERRRNTWLARRIKGDL